MSEVCTCNGQHEKCAIITDLRAENTRLREAVSTAMLEFADFEARLRHMAPAYADEARRCRLALLDAKYPTPGGKNGEAR